MSPNLFWYLLWSSNILISALLMIACLMISLLMISSISWVTKHTEPWNFLTVLKRYFIYSAIPSFAIAFHASSITIIFLTPFSFRIFEMNVDTIVIAATLNKIGWSLI